ncbi:MAG TPA: sigma-70 family RNA polymerase sigma factor [Candidatus Limnocylindria bacterium]
MDATPEQPPDPGMEDATLVAALRSGDEAAFIRLVRRHHSALVRAALLHVRDRDVAEEVVQEGWIAVMKGLDRFQARSSLKTWIFRIVTNQARTRGTRERRTVPFSSLRPGIRQPSVDPSRFRPAGDRWEGHWLEPPSSWGPDASERLMARETQRVIAATLDDLPNAQRMVISLRDIQGWSSDEVCEALDISPGNQRVLLHRARARVRRALERYFDDDLGRNDRPMATTRDR